MENFGEKSSAERRQISSIAIPEAKKIRQPTKHYVYKIVVQWSNGSSTVIYRRYSMFFDFQVKLQELYLSLKEKNPLFQGDSSPSLPELPGKILFGRTQVHQVAEKRRVKIEEFCEALVALPSEISQSSLVLSFFNTWPEDTLHHSQLGSRDTTSPIALVLPNSPTSPTSSVINHPEEMEHLEQYRVVVDYERMDNHQVDLTVGQIVHVIEKHDTGWWMVVAEDEQGYAPAAHLEAIDRTYDSAEPECSPNEEYEVMDTFKAENDDEIELSRGDKVLVLYKGMDGWWKIRTSHGRIGFCPATILRRLILNQKFVSNSCTTGYESDKNIYEGLNIHKPPPRRRTLERNMKLHVYKALKSNKRNGSHAEDPASHYQVPKSTQSVSSGSDEGSSQIIDLSNPPFSPEHYELGPCFTNPQDSGSDHHIYENTEFNHSMDPKDQVSYNPHIYQNLEFEGPRKQEPEQEKEQEDEYINPQEFVKEEGAIRANGLPSSKQGYQPVSYRQVTIAEMPLSPPSSRESSEECSSHSSVVRAKLTASKSLGFIDTSNCVQDEEYVEMDPIYAPVAPDEPDDSTNNCSSGEDPKSSLVQSVGGIVTKKPKAVVKESQDDVVPRGRVLERTKSLEDLLGMDAGKNIPGSPLSSRKIYAGENTPNIGQKVTKNDYDRLELKGVEKPTNNNKKPEPAKKKPYHKSVAGSSPSSPGRFHKVQSPPTSAPPYQSSSKNMVDGVAIPPPPSVHAPSSSKGSFVPKTYIAIEGYESQAPGCLSFNAGDHCVLVRQSSGGWWYVNIGGREGWTPGDFWEEDKRSMSVAISQPPMMAPKKPQATKPRSQTHITSFTGKDNPPPLPPANKTPSNPPPLPPVNKSTSNFEARSNSIGESQKPSPKPQPGKSRGPPPPKPKAFNSSTAGGKKLEQSVSLDPMPPPPPPPRREWSQPVINGVQKEELPHNDYTLLENASTPTLEEHPWFVGSMEREKAEQFLRENGRQREFLVRERTNKKGYYALSIRYHYSVKHFNIDPKADGSYSMGAMHFSSIEEVVKHYQLNSLFIHDGQPIALGQPVRRKSKPSH